MAATSAASTATRPRRAPDGDTAANDFDQLYDHALTHERSVLTRVEQGTYTCTGGSVHYLVRAARS